MLIYTVGHPIQRGTRTMQEINAVIAKRVFTHFNHELSSGHGVILISHPATNLCNGLRTAELSADEYHAIAKLITVGLQTVGHDVTVSYDEADEIRAFVFRR